MKSNKWQTVRLGDVAEVIGGGTPSTTKKEYWGGNIPWISIKDFGGERKVVRTTEKYITEKGLNNSSTKILQIGELIISARGTVGEIAQLGRPMAFNQSCYGLRANEEQTTNNFLYYTLKKSVLELKQQAHGSVFDTITTNTLKNLQIPLPPIAEQERIAGILSSFDEKIELNQQICRDLERMARLLFRRDFLDHPERDTWEVAKLGDVAECYLGGTPARNKPEYWNGNIPWINSGKVNEFRILQPSEFITEQGLKNSSTKLLPENTVVIAITGATLGQISITCIETCANQSVVGIISKDITYIYIYFWMLANVMLLSNMQTGGAQQHINKENILKFKIVIPPKESLQVFEEMVAPMFEQIKTLQNENIQLTEMRDLLLKKLMSPPGDENE